MRVLVGEDAEEAGVDAQADARVDVLLRGLEPGVALGLGAETGLSVGAGGSERGVRTCLKMWWRRASYAS